MMTFTSQQAFCQNCFFSIWFEVLGILNLQKPNKDFYVFFTQEERRKAEDEAKRKAEAEAKRLAAEAEAQRRAEAKVPREAMGFQIRGVRKGDGWREFGFFPALCWVDNYFDIFSGMDDSGKVMDDEQTLQFWSLCSEDFAMDGGRVLLLYVFLRDI